MATEQLGLPPPVLQPEEGASFWRPWPTNGYVTVKTSPSYGDLQRQSSISAH